MPDLNPNATSPILGVAPTLPPILPTATAACLPNFLVLGAMRSGTTSLHHYLQQHPQIFMCPIKEPRFFAVMGRDYASPDFINPITGKKRDRPFSPQEWHGTIDTLEEYRSLFRGSETYPAVGEVSPLYLAWSQVAAPNMRQYVPGAKLIAILRQPVERAYSHYLLYRGQGFVDHPNFLQAFVDYPHLYQGQGYYAALLQPYFERFRREQLYICLYDDLAAAPITLLQDMFRFLDIDDTFLPDVSVHFMQSDRRGQEGLSPGLKRALTEFYRRDIARLAEMLGRDLSAWL